jgi:arylformamidase
MPLHDLSHSVEDGMVTYRVHSLLLREEVPIVEHLTGLEALPASGARFYALPVMVRGFGTFPVRAFAET